jgi:hypothetical protein
VRGSSDFILSRVTNYNFFAVPFRKVRPDFFRLNKQIDEILYLKLRIITALLLDSLIE